MAAVVSALVLLAGLASPVQADNIPHFTVNLDEAPQERWKEVIFYYKAMDVIGRMTPFPSEEVLPNSTLREWFDLAWAAYDEDFRGEIDGWVKYAGDQNVTRDTMVFGTVLYDINYPTYCSGILAMDEKGGVYHGRNMDWMLEAHGKDRDGSPKTYTWADLTIIVTFTRGGMPIIVSATWPAQLTIHSAMRYGGYSIQQNTRRPKRDADENLAALRAGGMPFGMALRRAMNRVSDFEEFVQELQTLKMISTSYFLVAGSKPYQGAVIAGVRMGEYFPDTPKVERFSKDSSRWWILQTNDDANQPPADTRRPAQQLKLGLARQSDVSAEWIRAQMSTPPLQHMLTQFSFVAKPSTGYFSAWTPMDPRNVSFDYGMGGKYEHEIKDAKSFSKLFSTAVANTIIGQRGVRTFFLTVGAPAMEYELP